MFERQRVTLKLIITSHPLGTLVRAFYQPSPSKTPPPDIELPEKEPPPTFMP